MKTLIATTLIALSFSANAALFILASSAPIDGSSFACTYEANSVQITIINRGICPAYINR